jgi:hypothetical protein
MLKVGKDLPPRSDYIEGKNILKGKRKRRKM